MTELSERNAVLHQQGQDSRYDDVLAFENDDEEMFSDRTTMLAAGPAFDYVNQQKGNPTPSPHPQPSNRNPAPTPTPRHQPPTKPPHTTGIGSLLFDSFCRSLELEPPLPVSVGQRTPSIPQQNML